MEKVKKYGTHILMAEDSAQKTVMSLINYKSYIEMQNFFDG
jgi:hypothetical protein